MVGDCAGKPCAVGFLHRTSTSDNKNITFCMQKKQSYKRRERNEAVRCAFCLTRKEIKRKKKKLNKSARAKKNKLNTSRGRLSLRWTYPWVQVKLYPWVQVKSYPWVQLNLYPWPYFLVWSPFLEVEAVFSRVVMKKEEEQLKIKNMLSPRIETTRFDKRAAQSASPRLVP